ncbi:MAG TPA: ABC transporter substrate-binding protein, partial [Chthoniobacterales bacterium]
FAAQAIRRTAEIGWKPLLVVASPASSIEGVLKPAGVENAVGVITTQFTKQAGDPSWANDQEVADFKAFMAKYDPADSPFDFVAVSGYITSQAVAVALERCGKELTRENLLKQATSFKNVRVALHLPGITINNSSEDYSAYKVLRIARFDGKNYVLEGDAVSAD